MHQSVQLLFLTFSNTQGWSLFFRVIAFPETSMPKKNTLENEHFEPQKYSRLEFGNPNYLHGTQMNSKITVPETNDRRTSKDDISIGRSCLEDHPS